MTQEMDSSVPLCLLESEGFPCAALSEIAEAESWRKEVYRPAYHIHKWWAQRLGSVFRACILGAALPPDGDLIEQFYEQQDLNDFRILDPFMGSGTTVGEALKLGCKVAARDINPVPVRTNQTWLRPLDRDRLCSLFSELEAGIGKELLETHRTTTAPGQHGTVLYYFWVKTLSCPMCRYGVDLFSTRILARHAYAKKHPEAKASCPECGEIVESTYNSTEATCGGCAATFNPQTGPARRSEASCPSCNHSFSIVAQTKGKDAPPSHRLFAKLVLLDTGKKVYVRANKKDESNYAQAVQTLDTHEHLLPNLSLEKGYNTKQALNYGYTKWRHFFNARQLQQLSQLRSAILNLPASRERDALLVLWSGTLEFNNMFASYKGEGTGAVRHMFSHHVLKPERTPIEANLWGTPKSSGSFSTLFRSRLLRMLDYREGPFEVAPQRSKSGKVSGKKIFIPPAEARVSVDDVQAFEKTPRSVWVSCGDSADTGLSDRSVDAIVTDPPFFDNVHYSELADFFQAWHCDGSTPQTTRSSSEVQDTNSKRFATKLGGVFSECERVLRPEGTLVFSYHHSRDDGWLSVAEAIFTSGFSVTAAQPVKAELSVATPKSQAKSPINVDIILVCRKSTTLTGNSLEFQTRWLNARKLSERRLAAFNASGRGLSQNDIKVMLVSQFLAESKNNSSKEVLQEDLGRILKLTGEVALATHEDQRIASKSSP